MKKTVLIPIAPGIEEIETICLVDVLRRSGAQVTLASVAGMQIKAAHGVMLGADCLIEACQTTTYDLIVLPGGLPGATNLRDSKILKELLIAQKQAQRLYGAICASPAVVLAPHGLLADRTATAYPALSDQLPNPAPEHLEIVVAQNCITSQGPGTALAFALKLVELLYDRKKAQEVAEELLVTYGDH